MIENSRDLLKRYAYHDPNVKNEHSLWQDFRKKNFKQKYISIYATVHGLVTYATTIIHRGLIGKSINNTLPTLAFSPRYPFLIEVIPILSIVRPSNLAS